MAEAAIKINSASESRRGEAPGCERPRVVK